MRATSTSSTRQCCYTTSLDCVGLRVQPTSPHTQSTHSLWMYVCMYICMCASLRTCVCLRVCTWKDEASALSSPTVFVCVQVCVLCCEPLLNSILQQCLTLQACRGFTRCGSVCVEQREKKSRLLVVAASILWFSGDLVCVHV